MNSIFIVQEISLTSDSEASLVNLNTINSWFNLYWSISFINYYFPWKLKVKKIIVSSNKTWIKVAFLMIVILYL